MGIVVGFLVGYVMGARAGREQYDQLEEAFRALLGSTEFQALAGQLQSLASVVPTLAAPLLLDMNGSAKGLLGGGLAELLGERLKEILAEALKLERAA